MGRNKIGNITEDVILIGGAAFAVYFLVIKPGVNSLFGNSTDPVISAQLSVTPFLNPFNYQFQAFINFYNNNTPTITAVQSSGFNLMNLFGPTGSAVSTANPTIQQFFQWLKANPGSPSPWGYLDTADLSSRSENLKSAIDVSSFNPLSTSNQAAAMSALSGFSNQLQVAFIANYFWWNFNLDLLSYLQGSLSQPGLTSANLVSVINQVNNLPVNPS